MGWRLSTGGGYVVEDDGCLVPAGRILERVRKLEAELAQERALCKEIAEERVRAVMEVERLREALEDVTRAWFCSDGGAGGVEDIAASMDEARAALEGE